jgi:prepilin-type N-terminal cleavage/methylation domain-containing protein
MRRGFTLVEVLVALVLVEFGLLAVAATSAVAARHVAVATRAARARDAARERLESLRWIACDGVAEGSLVTSQLSEHWSVRGADDWRSVRDSVEYPLPAGRRGRLVLEEWVLCA